MPSVKELETFITVAEIGSFQGAARRMNATQPAISKRISELEAELGVQLFDRSPRSCRMTAKGRALVPYAQRVLGEIGEIQRTIGARASLAGHVRLGVVESIAYSKLPEILQRCAADLPELSVEVEVGATTDLVRKVRSHEIDIACVVAPVFEEGIASEPFWTVPMSWIAHGPRWTEGTLSVEALAEHTILLQSGSRHIPAIEGWFKSSGLRVKKIIRCNGIAAAVKLTAAGLGLSLVPLESARQELQSRAVTTVPVQVELPANSFVTIYPSGQVEPALGAVIEILRRIAAELLIDEKPATEPNRRAKRRTAISKPAGARRKRRKTVRRIA
jgi:DNA-binding transcriptional LysR family regulator